MQSRWTRSLVKITRRVQNGTLLVRVRYYVSSAINLLRQAFDLVVSRPLETVAVISPALLLMGGVGLITASMTPELLVLDPIRPDFKTIGSINLALALLASFALSYALMAILWHRHTLKETSSPLPMSPKVIFGYLWRVVALALIQLLAGLTLVLPLIAAGQGDATSSTGPAMSSMLLTSFLTQFLLVWLSLRLSLILPAAALGRPISIAHSWRSTRAISRSLWGVAAVLALINTTLSASVALVAPNQPGQLLAIELPIYILEGLLIFSVLTTLYAQQIQKVDINAT